MYGTVARLKTKPGAEAALVALTDKMNQEDMGKVPGYIGEVVYRLDSGGNQYMLAVFFVDKAAYVANAENPAQDTRYREMRALLDADPEWNDGEIIQAWGPLAGR